MKDLIRAYSIDDIIFRWDEEPDKEKLRVVLLNAFYEGSLKITDPITDMECFEVDEDIKQFLNTHKKYGIHYLSNGQDLVFNSDYFHAIDNFINYGSKSLNLNCALESLCVKKPDFLEWIKESDQELPDFWFYIWDRQLNPTTKTLKLREAAKLIRNQFSETIQKDLEAIESIRGIPLMLHKWFKHDTWKVKEGLMLLSGLSPETLFDAEQSTYGEQYRKVIYLKTLDGLEGDPSDSHANGFEWLLAFYEDLWNSGDHPPKAPPKYFIDWALQKNVKPNWLEWAVENGYYVARLVEESQSKEISGKSETGYLNIIGALLGLALVKVDKNGKRFASFKDQRTLIEAIHDNFGDTDGLSASNLQKKFSQALRSIDSR